MDPQSVVVQDRLSQIQDKIHRLEQVLAASPADAFAFMELGCLFAEADQREAAIEAFRQSYQHRTGSNLPVADVPDVDDQFIEAFDVALSQAPRRSQARTRELFTLAVRQQRRAETRSPLASLGAVALLVVMVLAVISDIDPAPVLSHGYWPTHVLAW